MNKSQAYSSLRQPDNVAAMQCGCMPSHDSYEICTKLKMDSEVGKL